MRTRCAALVALSMLIGTAVLEAPPHVAVAASGRVARCASTTTVPRSVGPLARVGTYKLGSLWITVTRGTRHLRTLIVYPREPRGLRLPVLVFAHGWDNDPGGYLPVLKGWASAGIVVVAPTAPGMAKGLPLIDEQVANTEQLADLPVVLTKVLRWHLPVLLDPEEVAYAGHSDGALAVAAMALNPTYHDRRACAYFLLSPGVDKRDGAHDDANVVPVYVADSYRDQYGLWPSARYLYGIAARPKALVGIGRGETHLSPWVDRDGFTIALWQSTVDFYRWALTHAPRDRARVLRDLAIRGFGVTVD
jgi:predicted esterase